MEIALYCSEKLWTKKFSTLKLGWRKRKEGYTPNE